ncbi:hypothetical protein [Actinomadura kijaniata]|uniref:hypothetical protein n=1 Tax=Actinomadura kijaniata TaxID=46161 RepID=UPI00083324CB|nr:hypothetical protein [Actinomadura kijaniata]
MRTHKPALLAATLAAALLPVTALTAPAEAAWRPAPRAAAQQPSQEELIKLVLACFPANIQADVALILAGDYVNGATRLLTDVSKLTPEQLKEIATKLLGILDQLPKPQQAKLRAQLKKGLTRNEALQIVLASR